MSPDGSGIEQGQVMNESASVEVLSAEVRVLQVGDGQITRSMYGQLDEAPVERFEPFGRVRDNEHNPKEGVLQLVGRDTKTGALVRYDPPPPHWSSREGPVEFAHWLLHTEQRAPYPVAVGPDGRGVVWTRKWDAEDRCRGPFGWHVSKNKPDRRVVHLAHEQWSYSQWLEKNRASRCTVDLGELEQAWRAKAAAQLAELLDAQAKYDEFKALPLIVLPD
jgi:hypothetical protein